MIRFIKNRLVRKKAILSSKHNSSSLSKENQLDSESKGEPPDSDSEKLIQASQFIKEMTSRLPLLHNTTAKEIMVPRVDLVYLKKNTDFKQMMESIIISGHSRIPVINKSIDNIAGILYVKDLFSLFEKYNYDFFLLNQEFNLENILHDAYYVPESKRVLSLLKEFQCKKIHIAIIVDEYGGTSGLVSLEDIIEEIVGDIQDEYDHEEEEILPINSNTYSIDALTPLEDINKKFKLSLPENHSDTIGGFVYYLFGGLPAVRESISFENIEFMVTQMEEHKLKRIQMKIFQ